MERGSWGSPSWPDEVAGVKIILETGLTSFFCSQVYGFTFPLSRPFGLPCSSPERTLRATHGFSCGIRAGACGWSGFHKGEVEI